MRRKIYFDFPSPVVTESHYETSTHQTNENIYIYVYYHLCFDAQGSSCVKNLLENVFNSNTRDIRV